MVKASRLGGACGAGVVMTGDRVEQLGARSLVELRCAFLHEPQAEMDVAEQAPFLRDLEPRPRLELARAADVVEQSGGEQQVRASRGWSCTSSRQIVATPTVCSSSPPA